MVVRLESFRDRHGQEAGERNRDSEVLDEAFSNVGAVLMGKRMFDAGEGPWGDDPPFHLQAGLVDEFQIHVAPVLLGAGRRLFDDRGDQQVELEKTRMIDSPTVTHLRYRVAR